MFDNIIEQTQYDAAKIIFSTNDPEAGCPHVKKWIYTQTLDPSPKWTYNGL